MCKQDKVASLSEGNVFEVCINSQLNWTDAVSEQSRLFGQMIFNVFILSTDFWQVPTFVSFLLFLLCDVHSNISNISRGWPNRLIWDSRFKHHYSFNQCTFGYISPKLMYIWDKPMTFLTRKSKVFTYCKSWKSPYLDMDIRKTFFSGQGVCDWREHSVSTFVSVSSPLDIRKETSGQFQISKHIFVMRSRDISSHVWGNFLHKTQNVITRQ